MDKCVFCECPLDDGREVVTLGVKGCQGIPLASQVRGSTITTTPGQRVHVECRHCHCNKRRIEQSLKRSHDAISDASGSHVSIRSGQLAFNLKENCLFCEHINTFDNKHQRTQVDSSPIT